MELKKIIANYKNLKRDDKKMALATVVRVKGSSYRSPGARMLMTTEGMWIGSISGGCLEGDALRKARKVIAGGVPEVVTYDTSEDENGMAFGLGCNGIIDVLIEPISGVKNDPMKVLSAFEDINATGWLIKVVESNCKAVSSGEVIYKTPETGIVASNRVLQTAAAEAIYQLEENRSSGMFEILYEGEKIEVFAETMEPPIRLLVFGGGFDVRPLVAMASKLGWVCDVTDECMAHVAPAFFPDADRVAHCRREYALNEFKLTAYTACVLMSHNFEYDKEIFKQLSLSQIKPHYIGILGPKKRFDHILSELDRESIDVSAILPLTYSPIGLDIGAETPEEIALSILAEIKTVFTGRSGAFLKNRKAPIHNRTSDQEILKTHKMEE